MTDKSDKNLWVENLQTSLVDNQHRPESKYFQLATVNEHKLPEVRTVVFRGYLENASILIMHSDIRSNKISQIESQSCAQICWYFSDSREQYRFTGSVNVIDSSCDDKQALRQQQWQTLSVAARQAYGWEAPGKMLTVSFEQQDEDITQKNISNELESVNENFVLLLFSVQEVDHLQLNTTPHSRKRYHIKNNQWQEEAINP